jgi:hypothetical protein
VGRIVLIHAPGEPAREHADLLRRSGHRVVVPAELSSPGLSAVRDAPPDAFVVDLDRRPAQAREVAVWLRRTATTRSVPIVFAGGDADAAERVRETLPDAAFTPWSRVRSAVRRAMREAARGKAARPIVPSAPGFGTGTPLPRKLGIRAGTRVALLGAPPGFRRTLAPWPDGVHVTTSPRGRADLIVLFARSRTDLLHRLPAACRRIAPGGSLWVAWPKVGSRIAGDLTQQVVRDVGLGSGLVDYRIARFDETWAGLRFALRPEGKRKTP